MGIVDKIRRFFLEQPRASVVFQISPSYLAALKVGPEREAVSNFVYHPLSPGVVEAGLFQKNVLQPGLLLGLVEESLKKLKPEGDSTAVILPEMSSRVFILPLENSGMSASEQKKFVEWRLGSQLSRPVSELRYSYQSFNSGRQRRLLVLCTGEQVAEEYEKLFRETRLKPGKLIVPSIAVLNLVMRTEPVAGEFLLVDVDADYLSLIAMEAGSPYLYRQKQIWSGYQKDQTSILKEIENTIQFMEDRNRKKPDLVWLRSTFDDSLWLLEEIKKLTGVRVEEVRAEQKFLEPLLGGI
ncbi:MAG: hypothetical protein QME28_02455 [Candidatus Saccharicenans sp.]|nr:hypothetical protein [Candidatus Saccharicenans sp.]